jgi:hypothetical protein
MKSADALNRKYQSGASSSRNNSQQNSQSKGAKDNLQRVDGEDVGNPQSQAQNHGQNTEPITRIILLVTIVRSFSNDVVAFCIVVRRFW